MNIRIYPDPVLRIKSEPVSKLDRTIHRIIKEMKKIMSEEEGIGLAANQVGITKRIMILDFFDRKEALINPDIVSASEEEEEAGEGCLSFPEIAVPIKRPISLRVRYMDEQGIIREENLADIHARAFQHELDHLNGKLIIDYMNSEMKLEYNLKIARNGVNDA